MQELGAFIAIRAINELANSALPDAPVRPDPPRRRPLHRLINAARRPFQGTGAFVRRHLRGGARTTRLRASRAS